MLEAEAVVAGSYYEGRLRGARRGAQAWIMLHWPGSLGRAPRVSSRLQWLPAEIAGQKSVRVVFVVHLQRGGERGAAAGVLASSRAATPAFPPVELTPGSGLLQWAGSNLDRNMKGAHASRHPGKRRAVPVELYLDQAPAQCHAVIVHARFFIEVRSPAGPSAHCKYGTPTQGTWLRYRCIPPACLQPLFYTHTFSTVRHVRVGRAALGRSPRSQSLPAQTRFAPPRARGRGA